MKKNLSKILLALFLVAIITTGCGKKNEKPVEKPNTTIPDVTVEGLKISGMTIVYDKGISQAVATVTNNNETDFTVNMVEIKLFDKDGKEVVTTYGYVGKALKNNESATLICNVTSDITAAKKAEYKIMK